MKIKNIAPWLFVPLFLFGVYVCTGSWQYVTVATTVSVMVTMLVLLVAVRELLRRDGLCRDAASSAFILIPFCALMLARLSMFDYMTLDYEWFLSPWVEYYRESGGFAGLGEAKGNYNVPYLTWLALFSYLPVYDLYLIKLLSVVFDVALAFFLFKIAGEFTDNPYAKVMCFLITLVLPTPFMNSAVWGQCDSVYASFCAAALYFAIRTPKTMQIREKYIRFNSIMCYICAAFALAYKLQAVFIMPVILPLFFAKKLKLQYIWLFPVVYIVLISPALLAGRGFIDTMTIYFNELGTVGDGLNYNSPSMFSLRWQWDNPEMWSKLGILFSAAVCLMVAYLAFFRRKRLSPYSLTLLAAILAVGVPLFLPHMHERYFYLADVLILPLAVAKPKLAPAVALSGFASILGYYAYLRQQWLLTMNFGFYALAAALVILVAAFILEPRGSEKLRKP